MFGLIPLIFFSVLAFWKESGLLFMIVAGISLMVGLTWYDMFPYPEGLGVSICLIVYSLVAIGFTFKCMLWREEE